MVRSERQFPTAAKGRTVQARDHRLASDSNWRNARLTVCTSS